MELVALGHKGSGGPTVLWAEDALGIQHPRESLWSLCKGNGSGVRPSTLQDFFLSYSPRRLAIKSNLPVLTEPAGGGDPVESFNTMTGLPDLSHLGTKGRRILNLNSAPFALGVRFTATNQ